MIRGYITQARRYLASLLDNENAKLREESRLLHAENAELWGHLRAVTKYSGVVLKMLDPALPDPRLHLADKGSFNPGEMLRNALRNVERMLSGKLNK